MDGKVVSMLSDLKTILERSPVVVNTLSTLARIANNDLVEKFFSESVSLKLPQLPKPDELASSQMTVLQSYIYTCCFWGSRDVLTKILELAKEHHLNIDLNAKNQGTLWTPLHAATFQEHGPIVMLLLENGANPNVFDSDGWSPIHFASVSDKIWPHFASRRIPRIPAQVLLETGMITRMPDQLPRNGSAGSPIPLMSQTPDYDRMSSGSSVGSAAAVAHGDVLAADNDANAQAGQNRSRSGFFY